MTTQPSSTRTNRELLKAMKTPVARFYPCDLHVHSIGSFDVCLPGHFETLPQSLREHLADNPGAHSTDVAQLPLSREPANPAEHDQAVATPTNIKAVYDSLLARRDQLTHDHGISESDNWAIIGVTDHNTAYFSTALAQYAWERKTADRLIVVPGLELQVSFPFGSPPQTCQVHILCLYPPCTSTSDIRLAINESRPQGTDNWDFGKSLTVSDIPSFVQSLRSHRQYPAVCIAAHVGSPKGIESESKRVALAALEAEIARLEGERERAQLEGAHADEADLTSALDTLTVQTSDTDRLHLDVLKLIGRCGFDALQIRDASHETHYRRLHRFREQHGRSVPIVCSDAHTPNQVFVCPSGVPFAKLSIASAIVGDPSVLFDELRNRILRFGETRTTYAVPKSVTHWIEGIEIIPDAENARQFWQALPADSTSSADAPTAFTLPLSRNLNCFVGGRGSGKSAGIEAIAFLTVPNDFTEAGRKRKRPDWYDRAEATLSGCRLRLVWKTTASNGIGALPKRALILSRYFDPDSRHGDLDIRDADGNAIVDDTITPPTIRILRSHEIENTARPENLRKLFDDLCGPRIQQLAEAITSARAALSEQRVTIVNVCCQLAELTKDGSPLRQYGIRKHQFETVNRPELREKYEKADRAEAISKAASTTVENWTRMSPRSTLDHLETDLVQFFDATQQELLDDAGNVREGYEPLHALVRTAASPDQPGNREEVMAGLASAKTAIDTLGVALNDSKTVAATKHNAETDELARQGLPTGSSERDAKKRAFDAAAAALKSYNDLTQELDGLLDQRGALHETLVTACEDRTNLRKTTAEAITRQLARDLDAAVLRIELDARPLAAHDELNDWLEQNVDPVFPSLASNRRQALIANGVMPTTIRDILLHRNTPSLSALEVNLKYAKDGRITTDEAQQILDRCRAWKTSQLDEAGNWSEEFLASIPPEIRNGVSSFPAIGNGPTLCIDQVLRLDEIVLDDLPEIRLNDRPTDPGTEPRPLVQLSPGQRCSAILPILLLSGDHPLVIDQPEENLDNRLIRQVIVNILAAMKLKRQVIIATHNPNLPVLGDVEQCVVLQASGRDLSMVVATGNLDSPDVSRYVTDIMEGGREAFQYRQSIYQSHWTSAVDEGPDS